MATQPTMPHRPMERAEPTQAERLREAIQTWAVYAATTPGNPAGDLHSEVIDRCPHVVHSLLDWTKGNALQHGGVLPCDDGSILVRAVDGTWQVHHDHWESREQGHALRFVEGQWYRFVLPPRSRR